MTLHHQASFHRSLHPIRSRSDAVPSAIAMASRPVRIGRFVLGRISSVHPLQQMGRRAKSDNPDSGSTESVSPTRPKTTHEKLSEAARRSGATKETPPKLPLEPSRLERARNDRIYLIGRRDSRRDYEAHGSLAYVVSGTTGNVYYPMFSKEYVPTCTCRDQRVRKKLCKHILFVLTRVLKMDADHDPKDIDAMIERRDQIDVSKSVLAPQRVRSGYMKETGAALDVEPAAASDDTGAVHQPEPAPIEEGDQCPICCSDLASNDTDDPLVWCRSCGGNVHVDCFERYRSELGRHNADADCPHCDQPWTSPDTDTPETSRF